MAKIAPGSELVAVAGSYVAEGSVLAEGSVVEIEGGAVEGSVIQGVVQGVVQGGVVEGASGVVEGGDPARITYDADVEAHQHGPQHGSVAVQRNYEDKDNIQGAVYSLVLCPIFGVLSCTVWEDTTAGTVVLTIAIILYVFGVFTTTTTIHPGMTTDLETEAFSPSELDAIVAEVNGARVSVCVHVRCSHSFWASNRRTFYNDKELLKTEASFEQTDVFKYGERVNEAQNPSSVDMGGFGMCVVHLNVACDTDALTLGVERGDRKFSSKGRECTERTEQRGHL